MTIYFTADLHFGEERMEIMQRPFVSSEEMNNKIIENFNEVLTDKDDLIIVGDLVNKDYPELISLVDKIPAKRKILVRGNHDVNLSDKDLKKYFNEVYEDGSGIYVKPNKQSSRSFYVNHYPSKGKNDCYNLVGHIHAAWKFQLNMINIGVDANHFYPVSMDQINFFINAIENFYDDDVWAAYLESNAQYFGKRGKQGSYIN